MCEWAAMRLMPRSSLLSETVTTGCVRVSALESQAGDGRMGAGRQDTYRGHGLDLLKAME